MRVERYVRFRAADAPSPRWGVRRGDVVDELSAAPWRAGSVRTGVSRSGDAFELLAPAEPTKIVALAYNYRDLFDDPAARAGSGHYTDPGFEPLVFLKGINCLADPGAAITVEDDEVWVEVEVAAVVGRRARALPSAATAREAVFGVTIGNDVTALNVLGRDWHLARSKSRDGFCPLGPELVRGLDDAGRRVSTVINGRQTQSSTTDNRVLDTYEAVVMVSRIMTLEPGDVVLTGTPRGARRSLVRPGDRVELAVEGLGVLVNSFVGGGR